MSRERLGGWGVTLSRPDLAAALAAYGTIGYEQRSFQAERPDAELEWFAPHDAPPAGDATRFRDAWNRCLAEHRQKHGGASSGAGQAREPRVRLAVRAVPWDLPPRWLVATLASASGVSAVHLVEVEGSSVAWDWPLDVAILEERRSTRLGAARASSAYPEFVRMVWPHEATDQIDLLIVPGGPAAGADLARRRRPAARVHTVVALGPATGRDPVGALRALRHAARAGAAAACPVEPATLQSWIGQLARELAHDRTLDEALFAATRARVRTIPLVVAEPGALRRARAAVAAIAVGKRYRVAAPNAAARAPLPAIEAEAMRVDGRASVEDVARAMAAQAEAFDWEHEDHAASGVARMAAAKPAPDPARTATYLQAQVLERSGGGFEPVIERTLAPAREHRIDVFVGRPREGFARPEAGFPAPEPRPEGYDLTVVSPIPCSRQSRGSSGSTSARTARATSARSL